MSIHIGAKKGEIADTVLMPGDPLRAKYIAETFLKDAVCYTEVRGMYGYTGRYKGKKVSIQGSGMGIPSIGIYVNELINEYGVKRIMRIGSCGSLREEVKIRDIILGMSASTNSNLNDITFRGMTFAPTASYSLFSKAVKAAEAMKLDFHAGNILSTDIFYNDDPEEWKIWSNHNVLAVEMEAAALYTLAAKKGIEALTILTVSDSLITHEATSSQEREKTFTQMMELALETAIS
ncbi:purine-nucleoside phosphorylase [Oceanispirochaeta sp.]|jgi:purine-nucleoside phosphorylase|uniref:purine-nucleoside phosphorylase n=1 Tax=Oceanispirochaeta sp. TaxID=2035350 RepID=UPI0026343EF0|nr:purine-nucleoside phosphorylase [Oceanispirochaeta sp.]MDA3957959.1 purine-nucleoside phosphorylase [Oceanispirochaeta sp.]